jgi:hypothetical protein
MIIFIYLVWSSTCRKDTPRTEGFAQVKYASDCTCNPGFLPQRCGDPVNSEYERDCVKDTYFCQQLTPPYAINSCRTNT